jgi:hypothetical protein
MSFRDGQLVNRCLVAQGSSQVWLEANISNSNLDVFLLRSLSILSNLSARNFTTSRRRGKQESSACSTARSICRIARNNRCRRCGTQRSSPGKSSCGLIRHDDAGTACLTETVGYGTGDGRCDQDGGECDCGVDVHFVGMCGGLGLELGWEGCYIGCRTIRKTSC